MTPLVWKGEEIGAMGEVIDAVCACRSPEEAREFRDAYRAVNEHADENLGYMTGYLDAATARRFRDWLEVSHPIFGAGTLSSQEAFTAGREYAREAGRDR